MPTNFPTSLDTAATTLPDTLAAADPTTTTWGTAAGHHTVHNNSNDALLALEAKVGITGSAVTTSLDYKFASITGFSFLAGLDPTGAVEATTILNAAIALAATSGGGRIPCPAGVFKINAAVALSVIPPGVWLEGAGNGTVYETIVGATPAGTFVSGTTLMDYGFRSGRTECITFQDSAFPGPNGSGPGANISTGGGMQNLSLSGQFAGTNVVGIRLVDIQFVRLDVRIMNYNDGSQSWAYGQQYGIYSSGNYNLTNSANFYGNQFSALTASFNKVPPLPNSGVYGTIATSTADWAYVGTAKVWSDTTASIGLLLQPSAGSKWVEKCYPIVAVTDCTRGVHYTVPNNGTSLEYNNLDVRFSQNAGQSGWTVDGFTVSNTTTANAGATIADITVYTGSLNGLATDPSPGNHGSGGTAQVATSLGMATVNYTSITGGGPWTLAGVTYGGSGTGSVTSGARIIAAHNTDYVIANKNKVDIRGNWGKGSENVNQPPMIGIGAGFSMFKATSGTYSGGIVTAQNSLVELAGIILNHRGEINTTPSTWNAGTAYTVGQEVILSSTLYFCVTANTNHAHSQGYVGSGVGTAVSGAGKATGTASAFGMLAFGGGIAPTLLNSLNYYGYIQGGSGWPTQWAAGSLAFTTQIKTATYTALNGDVVVCPSGTFTVTLPAPVLQGRCQLVNTGVGTITLATPSGILYSLTGGVGSQTYAQGLGATVSSDGTNWYRVA
jgi:hypothetical protein